MMDWLEIETGLIQQAHACVAEVLSPGDLAVDATVGNGHDTLFLAKQVGSSGKVIGFDVQEAAIASGKAKLAEHGISEEGYALHVVSHACMADYVTNEVAAVMFNLGYLPGSNKNVITQTEDTLIALNQAFGLLGRNGVLSVMCYPGHEGGGEEAQAVTDWFSSLANKGIEVRAFRRVGWEKKNPFLLVAAKS